MEIERKAEVFSVIERLYSRKRYVRGIRKFEKYKEISERIWERDKISRKKKSKEKKKRNKDKDKSKIKGV